MNPRRTKPSIVAKNGCDLSFSNESLKDLLQAVLEKGVPLRFRAQGFSMSPLIRSDDVITVSPLKGTSPGPGNIVAFIHPATGKVMVHRIVRKSRGFCLIKGDNSPEADGFIPQQCILGQIVRVEREGKEISFGLGMERFLIAYLSYKDIYSALILIFRRLVFSIKRKSDA